MVPSSRRGPGIYGTPGPSARLRILIVVGVVAASAVLLGAVTGGIVLLGDVDASALGVGSILLAVHGLLMLAVIRHLLRRGRITWASIGFRAPQRHLAHLAWQIPAGLALAIAVQLGFAATLDLEPQDNTEILGTVPALTPGWMVLLFLGAAVLAPLWEEAIFRGVILDGIGRRSIVLGVVVSGALFALLHAGIHSGTPFLFMMGVNLALVTLFYRSVWAAVIFHAANNALVLTTVLTAL